MGGKASGLFDTSNVLTNVLTGGMASPYLTSKELDQGQPTTQTTTTGQQVSTKDVASSSLGQGIGAGGNIQSVNAEAMKKRKARAGTRSAQIPINTGLSTTSGTGLGV